MTTPLRSGASTVDLVADPACVRRHAGKSADQAPESSYPPCLSGAEPTTPTSSGVFHPVSAWLSDG